MSLKRDRRSQNISHFARSPLFPSKDAGRRFAREGGDLRKNFELLSQARRSRKRRKHDPSQMRVSPAVLLLFVRLQFLYRSSPTAQIGKVFKPSSVRNDGRKEHRIGECVVAQFGRDFSLTLERRRHRRLRAGRACLFTREFHCEIFVTLERPVLPIEIQHDRRRLKETNRAS